MNKAISSLSFVLLAGFTSLVSATLLNEKLGSVALNMSFEQVQTTLQSGGWRVHGSKVSDRKAGKTANIGATKTANGDNFKMKVEFHPDEAGKVRADKITYARTYNSSKVDLKTMRTALVEKYGAPYRETNSRTRLDIRFSDAGETMPQKNAIVKQCLDEANSNGIDPLDYMKVRTGTGVSLSGHFWPTGGNAWAKKYCPKTVPAHQDFIDKLFAPALIATVEAASRRKGGAVTRTLQWQYPNQKYLRKQMLKKRALDAKKPAAALD